MPCAVIDEEPGSRLVGPGTCTISINQRPVTKKSVLVPFAPHATPSTILSPTLNLITMALRAFSLSREALLSR